MSRLFDTTSRVLQFAIEGTKLRHQSIVNNLANVDTPGFQSQDIEFQQALKEELSPPVKHSPRTFEERVERLANKEFNIAVRLSHEKKLPSNEPRAKVIHEAYEHPRLDANTVDIDREMAKHIENTFFHNAYLELLNRKFRMLKGAISGGRG